MAWERAGGGVGGMRLVAFAFLATASSRFVAAACTRLAVGTGTCHWDFLPTVLFTRACSNVC